MFCHRDSTKQVKVSEDILHRHQHDKHLDSNDCHSQEPCNIIVEDYNFIFLDLDGDQEEVVSSNSSNQDSLMPQLRDWTSERHWED